MDKLTEVETRAGSSQGEKTGVGQRAQLGRIHAAETRHGCSAVGMYKHHKAVCQKLREWEARVPYINNLFKVPLKVPFKVSLVFNTTA